MSTATYHVGDVFDVFGKMEDTSVDLVMSSPPFLALRSYLPADHPTKGREIGSEPTPADFLDTLLDVTEACDRVLAPHGSLVFELGDTFAGSGGAGGDWIEGSGQRVYKRGSEIPDFSTMPPRRGTHWPLDKSLTGIPTLFAWSLAYGRNLLRPERSTPPWRVRNLIPWCRPNPPVGALGDKFRPATTYLTVATKSRTRWFDMTAVRTPHTKPTGNGMMRARTQVTGSRADDGQSFYNEGHPAGAPLLDYWEISTQPYTGAHYATFPEELPRRVILSMCPESVCRVCGEPRRRLFDVSYVDANGRPAPKGEWKSGIGEGRGAHSLKTEVRTTTTTTTGWTDCAHADYRRGVVLDPFAGSGTTLAVACQLGRDSVGIDLDERNVALARGRISPHGLVEVVERDGTVREPEGQEALL